MAQETVTPDISIIIPTLQEGAFLERTLRALAHLTLPHELVVTDGGSTDETLEIARDYTDKVVVWSKPERQTFGEAKNAAARTTRGTYLVFIDADVLVPEPDRFFRELIALFEKHQNLVAVAVPLLPWPENRSLVDRFFCGLHNLWYTLSNNVFRYANSPGEFQMFRRTAFERVGGYDEVLTGGEDCNIFQRLGRIGRALYYTKLSVTHSLRRPHAMGWLPWLWKVSRQGFYVLLLHRTAYKEWDVIR